MIRDARFCQIMADAPTDDTAWRLVTDETNRYAHGEDVEPVAIDENHPGMWWRRMPSAPAGTVECVTSSWPRPASRVPQETHHNTKENSMSAVIDTIPIAKDRENNVSTRRFRKKPIEVEAVQWQGPGSVDGIKAGLPHVNPRYRCKSCGGVTESHGVIRTLEGVMDACYGDWIITGIQGERYPCKPEIFDATYEEVR